MGCVVAAQCRPSPVHMVQRRLNFREGSIAWHKLLARSCMWLGLVLGGPPGSLLSFNSMGSGRAGQWRML
jgi:hypothetical protein